MMPRRCSARGIKKQLEKELSGGQGTPVARARRYAAVRPLSAQESQEPVWTAIAYSEQDSPTAVARPIPRWGPFKARLCGWPNQPRFGDSRHIVVDAPIQLALARNWSASIGNVKAAFLNGVPAPRQLSLNSPLVEVINGVFGLSTSPKLWWMKLSAELLEVKAGNEGEEYHFTQNENYESSCRRSSPTSSPLMTGRRTSLSTSAAATASVRRRSRSPRPTTPPAVWKR